MFTTTHVLVVTQDDADSVSVSPLDESVGGVVVAFGPVLRVSFGGDEGQSRAASMLRRLADEIEALQ